LKEPAGEQENRKLDVKARGARPIPYLYRLFCLHKGTLSGDSGVDEWAELWDHCWLESRRCRFAGDDLFAGYVSRTQNHDTVQPGGSAGKHAGTNLRCATSKLVDWSDSCAPQEPRNAHSSRVGGRNHAVAGTPASGCRFGVGPLGRDSGNIRSGADRRFRCLRTGPLQSTRIVAMRAGYGQQDGALAGAIGARSELPMSSVG